MIRGFEGRGFRVAFAFVLAALLSGCKKDEEQKNAECEAGCIEKEQGRIVDCEEEISSCIATCSGPEDYSCIDDCEWEADCESANYYICVASCDCAKEVPSCAQDCGEDTECLTGCTEAYLECAGDDSPYLCVTNTCDVEAYSCTYACESSSLSASDYADCRIDCAESKAACYESCL